MDNETGIYLCGPVENDDNPSNWRDKIKENYPTINWLDPMDWQSDWDNNPAEVVQRELAAWARRNLFDGAGGESDGG
jgi:hypothetical protein